MRIVGRVNGLYPSERKLLSSYIYCYYLYPFFFLNHSISSYANMADKL